MNEKIKNHFIKHKEAYIVGGCSILVAGITCAIMRGKYTSSHQELDSERLRRSEPDMTVNTRPLNIFNNKPITSVVTVVEREGRGHTGYIIRCLETGDVYFTQNEAAEALHVWPSIISRHMNGSIPDINGNHLERVRPPLAA